LLGTLEVPGIADVVEEILGAASGRTIVWPTP